MNISGLSIKKLPKKNCGNSFELVKNILKSPKFFWRVFLFNWFLFLTWPFSLSAESLEVAINEIAWMGTETSYHDEWIELYNNTDQEINLNGWSLNSLDGTPQITLKGNITPHGYFLLERTDDDSVPYISADQIYTGALDNDQESLELRDSENNLIDAVNCSEKWFAGDNNTKQTMERINPTESGSLSTNWQTSQESGGTPRSLNSAGETSSSEESSLLEETTAPEEKPTPSSPFPNLPPSAEAGPNEITALTGQEIPFDASQSNDPNNDSLTYFWNFGDGTTDNQQKTTHTYHYPGQYLVTLEVNDGEFSDLDMISLNIYSTSIIISEFIPNPEGKDETNEWIELFNQGKEMANLSNWVLDDSEGGSRPFVFPQNTLIAPGQFLVLTRPTTHLALNNKKDQVRLFYPDGSLASEVTYTDAQEEGLSIAFNGEDYFWTNHPTPGVINLISSVSSFSDSDNKKSFLTESKSTTQYPPFVSSTLSPNEKFSALLPDKSLSSKNLIIGLNSNYPQPENIATRTDSKLSNYTTNKTTKSPSLTAASLKQDKPSSSRANLILALSIIISGSLLISWGFISFKKRQ